MSSICLSVYEHDTCEPISTISFFSLNITAKLEDEQNRYFEWSLKVFFYITAIELSTRYCQ